MIDMLKVMADIMKELNLTYDLLNLKKSLSYPYVIGEYYENDYSSETNCSSGEFLLTIWDKNESSLNIINVNEQIKKKMRDYKKIENGTAVLFKYSNSLPEIQEANNLKKQEIRIDVQYFEKGE